MEYTCTRRDGTRTESWAGEITMLRCDRRNGQYEAEISGRGTYFHILAGRHKYGNYLCIPNHDVGCELAELSDVFWNEEKLRGLMREVDAVTVAAGLAQLAPRRDCLKD